jgi:hypothetical protein
MQPITSSSKSPVCNAQYNTCINNKARFDITINRYNMHRGLPFSNEKLGSSLLGACVLPTSSKRAFSSCGKMPMTMGLTHDDMHILLIKRFDSINEINLLASNATIQFDIFHG